MPNDDHELKRKRIRIGWLVPIVAVSISLGVVGALGVTGQIGGGPTSVAPTASPSPSPTATVPDGSTPVVPIPGDLESADLWFKVQGEPAPADAYPDPEQLEGSGIDLASIRFMLSQDEELFVWVAKSDLGGLCLLAITGDEGTSARGCTSREAFAKSGIEVGTNGFLVSWFGEGVTVERTTG